MGICIGKGAGVRAGLAQSSDRRAARSWLDFFERGTNSRSLVLIPMVPRDGENRYSRENKGEKGHPDYARIAATTQDQCRRVVGEICKEHFMGQDGEGQPCS